MYSQLDVIQAPLADLFSMQKEGSFQSSELQIYAEVIEAYLLADAEKLSLLSKKLTGTLETLTDLRLQIVRDVIDAKTLCKLEDSAGAIGEWEGEVAFVLGLAYWSINDNEKALVAFRRAYKELERIGAKRKAVKSLLNIIVSEDRIDRNKKCITSYQYVKDKAMEVGDSVVAGICFHNMAKEYLKLGGVELSLKYSNSALELLKRDRGAIHYYEAVLHRCHTFIMLERFQEALCDFQTAKSSDNLRIQEALKAVEVLLGDKKEVRYSHLEPAWRTKLQSQTNGIDLGKLTKLESIFVEAISKSALTKRQLVDLIYGSNIDVMSADNRLNVFLTRFRKKFPGSIVVNDETYALAENNLSQDLSHEVG